MRMPIRRRFPALLRLFVDRPNDPRLASGGTDPLEAQDPAVSYLTELLADTREELNRVDSKAALLLAAFGVIIGSLLAGLFSGSLTPFELNIKIEWMWWLGVTLAAVGVFSIAAAVYPKIRRGAPLRPGGPAYFGDVASYSNVDAFRQAIEETLPNPRERLIDQTFVLSNLVQRKYVLLRRGLRCLLLAILACAAAILINLLLSH
jgi:MFS family permease